MKMRRLIVVMIGAMILGGCTFQENHTLRWDQVLLPAQRFVVLLAFKLEAVRDNETGLVWEKSPQTINRTWTEAREVCARSDIGGRKGWRLPSVIELASLLDPSVPAFDPPGPSLPPGHPFTGTNTGANGTPSEQNLNFWSATTSA